MLFFSSLLAGVISKSGTVCKIIARCKSFGFVGAVWMHFVPSLSSVGLLLKLFKIFFLTTLLFKISCYEYMRIRGTMLQVCDGTLFWMQECNYVNISGCDGSTYYFIVLMQIELLLHLIRRTYRVFIKYCVFP